MVLLVVPPGVDEGRAVSDDTISRLLETRHARALSYYSRAAQKGSARGAFAAARVRSKGAPGVPRDRKLAHKLFDDALQADPERMRWPVFLARAQLRCEEFWDDLRGVRRPPHKSGVPGGKWLSVGVAVLVVVVSVVRAVTSSGGAAPVVPEAVVPPSTTPVAVEVVCCLTGRRVSSVYHRNFEHTRGIGRGAWIEAPGRGGRAETRPRRWPRRQARPTPQRRHGVTTRRAADSEGDAGGLSCRCRSAKRLTRALRVPAALEGSIQTHTRDPKRRSIKKRSSRASCVFRSH